MAWFSDQELLFLCNLMHMKYEEVRDENNNYISPFQDVWREENTEFITIKSIINKIDTGKLRNDKYWSTYKFDGEISGAEWADMIDSMKKSRICELTLMDVNIDSKNALTTYFRDREGNAYVVFRGTGAGEWPDNFDGAYMSDTIQQQRALDYINSIDANNITVVGHSKGGNKAKYVALLSDKVTRCVSFDGQGFSRLFMDKYEDLIEKNKYKITCYALDYDFVNILLYDIYNKKYYVRGNGIDNFAENHSPNSFYYFHYNNNSKAIFSNVEISEQSKSMAILHSFVNYVDCTIPERKRRELYTFLGTVCNMMMGKTPESGYRAGYPKEYIMDYLTAPENADELGLLLAYIIEYEEYESGITEALFDVMDGLGWDFIAGALRQLGKIIRYEDILKFIIKHRDKAIRLLKLCNASDDLIKLIRNIGDAYDSVKENITSANKRNSSDYNPASNNYVRDYTKATRDLLLKLTDEVSNEKPYDVTKWDIWYRVEDWFGLLNIDNYTSKIESYFKKVIDINGTSHDQLQKIFRDIDSTVYQYHTRMKAEVWNIKRLGNSILEL